MVMLVKKLYCYNKWCFALLHLLLAVVDVCHGNRADDLVGIINQNRTSHKLQHLNSNPGLGCMALQYVELCKTNCSGNAVNCKPPEDDFTEVFAPNCGVELPTIGTLTGLIVGCQSKYVVPSLAFSDILVKDNKTLSVLRNKSHTEVGVGIVGAGKHKKGPYFWCVLFSNGANSSSFVLEDHGIGIKQKTGCFSSSTFPCSSGPKNKVVNSFLSISVLGISLLKFLL
ncbi:hypothetical protein ACFE04_018180 [Oxalis oulophora]